MISFLNETLNVSREIIFLKVLNDVHMVLATNFCLDNPISKKVDQVVGTLEYAVYISAER